MTDEKETAEPTDAIPAVDVPEKSPSQKLKDENDALQTELLRAQKIRNEALLAGTSGGNVKTEPKEETSKEYAARIEKEIQEGKHNDR